MGGYNANWPYRVKITVDKDEVPSDASDFTISTEFSDFPAAFISNIKSDGSDIRITQADGSTEQARAIISVDVGSSTGEMLVKSANLPSGVDLELYAYYGYAGASEPAPSDPFGSENCVDADTISLYTFQQDPTGGAPQLTDISSNGLNGTVVNNVSSATGQLGNAWVINGTIGDYITLPANAGYLSSGFSFSMWIYKTSQSVWGRGFDFHDSATGPPGASQGAYFIFLPFGPNSKPEIFLAQSGYSTQESVIATTNPGTGSWHLYSGSISSGGVAKIYIDGVLEGTNNSFSWDLSDISIDELWLGESFFHDFGLAARFDLSKFSKTVRSDDWFLTEFNNQNNTSTFYTVGAQEANPGPGGGAVRALSNTFNGGLSYGT